MIIQGRFLLDFLPVLLRGMMVEPADEVVVVAEEAGWALRENWNGTGLPPVMVAMPSTSYTPVVNDAPGLTVRS